MYNITIIINYVWKQNRVIPMVEQIQQFKTVHGNISQNLNDPSESRIHQSLFLFSVGSNDILEFFDKFRKTNPDNATQEVQQFITTLMNQYQAHLQVCHVTFVVLTCDLSARVNEYKIKIHWKLFSLHGRIY